MLRERRYTWKWRNEKRKGHPLGGNKVEGERAASDDD